MRDQIFVEFRVILSELHVKVDELRSSSIFKVSYLWQVNPRHHGQIVMFIVIANVERDLVQYTVV